MEHNQNPYEDYVYCITASPNFKKDGLVFAAKKSGLYYSRDRGKTWEDAYASLKLVAPLPTSSAAVSIVHETTYVFAGVEGKILRSLNAGESWEAADLGSPAPQVAALAVSPDFARDGTLLAATVQDGIFRTTDRGVSWTGWNFGLFDPNINALQFRDSQDIFAGTQSGIFHSINSGRSWRDLDFPVDSAPVLCLAVNRDGIIYAGTETEGLHVSCDEGKTWEELIEGTVEQVHVSASGKLLILRYGELLLSINGSSSWQAARPGFEPVSDISAFTTLPGFDSAKGKKLLVGLSNGEIIKL
jgi:photosystem II stability/assembly factor-like uncharacterized protein